MNAIDLVPLQFKTDEGFGARARIGLIVLESDQTIEREAHMIDLDGVAIYHARIPNDTEVTPQSLTAMEQRLPVAAQLLPTEFEFDAIGYGCTSAATLIGAEGVTSAIQRAHPDVPCSNPISAAVAAFGALDAKRIAVVTPYTAEVTRPIVDHFIQAGLEISTAGSFLELSDLVVARISESSIAEGVRIVAKSGSDAVFVSCTSLRTMGILEGLEADVEVPVVSSNLALFWHLLRLAGVDDQVEGFGTLLSQPLDP